MATLLDGVNNPADKKREANIEEQEEISVESGTDTPPGGDTAPLRGFSEAERQAAKDDRKNAEFAAMLEEQIERARNLSPEAAEIQARADVSTYNAAVTAGDKHFALSDMQVYARENAAYRDSLAAADPEVSELVKAHDPAGKTVVVNAAAVNAAIAAEALDGIEKRREGTAGQGMEFDMLRPEKLTEFVEADVRDARALANNPEQLAQAVGVLAANMKNAAYAEELDATKDQEAAQALRLLVAEHRQQEAEREAKDREERRRREEAAALAADAAAEQNSATVERKGVELERDEFIMPRRITQNYAEVDGKFYAKDGNRLMFQDQGNKLATSTTDKATIADMVALAKAKQWESLKLTGTMEFRREVWLQAESQGIKTQGYTPKESDLAALKSLTAERSTNLIAPVQDRAKDRAPTVAAPRHDVGKNQAVMSEGVKQRMTSNVQELRAKPGFEKFSPEDLSKIAFYRGVLMEREKDAPPEVRESALADFDKSMQDPAKVRELPQVQTAVEERAEDRSKVREEARGREEEELSR